MKHFAGFNRLNILEDNSKEKYSFDKVTEGQYDNFLVFLRSSLISIQTSVHVTIQLLVLLSDQLFILRRRWIYSFFYLELQLRDWVI